MPAKIGIDLAIAGHDPNETVPLTGLRHRTDDGIEVAAIPVRLVGGVTESMLDSSLTDDMIIRQATGTPWPLDDDVDITGDLSMSGSQIAESDGSLYARANTPISAGQALELRMDTTVPRGVIGALDRDLAVGSQLVSLRFEGSDFDWNFQGIIRATWNSTEFVIATDLRISNANIRRSVTSGLVASTTQTQGQGALTNDVNEIATVANANDTVTLHSAASGLKIIVINNGANTLQIFPASGDDLGAGVDASTTLASGSNITFVAYDATNWETV